MVIVRVRVTAISEEGPVSILHMYVSYISWRWKHYVLPKRCYPTYLQNDTASCATRMHHSACLSELRIQCAIRYYAVLLPPNNNQLKWFCLSLKRQGKPQGPVSIFSPDVPAGFILLFILFWDSVWCNFSKHPCEENRDFFRSSPSISFCGRWSVSYTEMAVEKGWGWWEEAPWKRGAREDFAVVMLRSRFRGEKDES